MENAVSDGTGCQEGEDGDGEGVKEIEDKGFSGEDGGILPKEAEVGFDGDEGVNG